MEVVVVLPVWSMGLASRVLFPVGLVIAVDPNLIRIKCCTGAGILGISTKKGKGTDALRTGVARDFTLSGFPTKILYSLHISRTPTFLPQHVHPNNIWGRIRIIKNKKSVSPDDIAVYSVQRL
jgi:hypothetical protein